jgi:hypothetical protein
MNIQNEGILNSTPGDPNGYVTKNGEWAAVLWTKKKYVIIHNGQQVHTANNYKTAVAYIKKAVKGKSVSTLTEFL